MNDNWDLSELIRQIPKLRFLFYSEMSYLSNFIYDFVI
jgi:hypothetical protein